MRQCMDMENLHRRLKRVDGQIKAIDRMIEQDVPCEDIIIQINAAKTALHKIGQVVLEGHLNHCVKDGIEHGDAEKTIADFAKAVEYFSRLQIVCFSKGFLNYILYQRNFLIIKNRTQNFLNFMSYFAMKSAKQNSQKMDNFIDTEIKSNYNIVSGEVYPNQMIK